LTFQNHTNRPLTDFGGKTSIFSHPVYLFLREFSLQDFRGGSLWCHIQYLFPGLLSVQGQVNQITPRRIAAVQGCPDPPLYFIRTPYNGVLARPGMITAPSRP
ncbi:hypothetical protein, partial [Escherichia coli]|uniref:hypothetical protein n=1 Tax=Escherichia coli TaxID=562 RepID=UPI002666DF61